LEAGAFGRPTLALRGGGYLDTVEEGVTGLFFARAEAADIAQVVVANRAVAWDAGAIMRHGKRFDEETFRDAITTAVAALGPGDPSPRST
jgi:glycosyltransferase involved in cell wall biosynthesis